MDLADLIVEREDEGYFAYHRSALTSEALHRAEIEDIFNRCWLYLGHESEIPEPGDFVRRTVGTKPLFFVRSQTTGKVRVFANSCTPAAALAATRKRSSASTTPGRSTATASWSVSPTRRVTAQSSTSRASASCRC